MISNPIYIVASFQQKLIPASYKTVWAESLQALCRKFIPRVGMNIIVYFVIFRKIML